MIRRVWLPLSIAVVLHMALAVSVAPRFEVDSAFYRAQAENLVARGASLDADGQPETRYTPGYPLFLALFIGGGLGYSGAMAAQHLLWIAVTAAAMWLVLQASGSELAAAFAGIITTVDLPGLQASISVLSETLAAATLTATVCCTWLSIRATSTSTAIRWAVVAGLLAGATALVRPIAVVIGVPLALAIMFGADRRWRLAAAGSLLTVFAVLPALWTVRNARHTGVATFSSLSGINLLHFRAAGTLAIRDPGGIDANLIRRRDELEQIACRNLEARYQRPCSALSWAERSGEYSSVALPIIFGDPVASGRQAARALGMILFGGSANLLAEVTGLRESTARIVCLLYTVPMAVLALAGIPYWWKRDRAFTALVLLVLTYMFVMALGAEAYSRFRVPVIALYAMMCGGGAAWLRERFS
jgi:hypothetical protein